jgi:ATP-dependent Clp protease ATP-binding subunit ClpX
MIEVDTKNILFIAGGAFIGLNSIINNRKQDAGVSNDSIIPDDLIRYGMIPELIGRFTSIANVEELTKNDLVKILTKVKNNYINQYKYLLSLNNIELDFNEDAIFQLVENTLKLKTGARGLHTEIEKVLMPHMYNTRSYRKNNIDKVIINKDLILNPRAII